MLENYNIEDLIIGELVTTSNLGGFYGTLTMTEGPFIFNKKGEKYSEIFTEEEYGLGPKPSVSTGGRNYKVSDNVEANKFGKTYIKETDSILNYLTEEELLAFNAAKRDNHVINEQIRKINIERRKNGEQVLIPDNALKFLLTKKRLLEIYNSVKEKQTIQKIRRENEEQQLEKQYTKTRPMNKENRA